MSKGHCFEMIGRHYLSFHPPSLLSLSLGLLYVWSAGVGYEERPLEFFYLHEAVYSIMVKTVDAGV